MNAHLSMIAAAVLASVVSFGDIAVSVSDWMDESGAKKIEVTE